MPAWPEVAKHEILMVNTTYWKEDSFGAIGSRDTEDGFVNLQISLEGVLGPHCKIYRPRLEFYD